MHYRVWRASLGIIGLLLIAGLLAACGSDSTGSTPAPPYVTLAAPGPACRLEDWLPLRDIGTVCAELVYDHVTPPEAAPELGGLVFAPDGTLFFVRTAHGEIWAMRDEDGDDFLDAPFRVAEGLTLPTGIAVHEGALFVVSVGGVVRLDDPNGDRQFEVQTVLVGDLPGDTGFWPGSIGIGPDGRLVVSLGAACNNCTDSGNLVSFAPDGSDRRVEATGLRHPADFAWDPATGDLWIVDGERVVPGVESGGPPDELNRFVRGADYGFPTCYGDRTPDPALAAPDSYPCAGTEPPAVTFPYQSNPSGVAFYTSDGFPFWQGDLLVVFRGSWNLPDPAGYALVAVEFADGAPDGTLTTIAPASRYPPPYESLAEYSISGRAFYPYRPVDVAVSPQGWIYVSIEEGRIYRFRPFPAASLPGAPTPSSGGE